MGQLCVFYLSPTSALYVFSIWLHMIAARVLTSGTRAVRFQSWSWEHRNTSSV